MKGFTLLELLVVIAITVILASVILASLQKIRCKENPNDETCKEQSSKEVKYKN